MQKQMKATQAKLALTVGIIKKIQGETKYTNVISAPLLWIEI